DALLNRTYFVTVQGLLHTFDGRFDLVQFDFAGALANLQYTDLNVWQKTFHVLALFVGKLLGPVVVTVSDQDDAGFTGGAEHSFLGPWVHCDWFVFYDPAATQL